MPNFLPFVLIGIDVKKILLSSAQMIAGQVDCKVTIMKRVKHCVLPSWPLRWALVSALFAAQISTAQARPSMREYSATLDNSSWSIARATALQCQLEHSIPRFGKAVFSSHAGREQNLRFEMRMTRQPDNYGLAQVISVPPQWRAGEQARAIADMKLLKQFHGDLPKAQAATMLTELEQGYSPTLYFADWYSPYDQIKASLNPIRFVESYDKFNECMAGLLPFSFEDIALTVLAYESNSDALTRESQARLNKIAQYLKHDKAIAKIAIDTYTDSYGGRWINDELSRKRAKSLKDFFVQAGVDATVIQTEGFGERRHVASNDTSQGRATNRRAVVQLVKQMELPQD